MTTSPCIMNPQREKGEPLITSPVLFCLNPADSKEVGDLLKKEGGRSYFLFNSKLMGSEDATGGQKFFACGPGVGAPMAVLILEKLIALGAQSIVVFGWCGSLSQHLVIGDVLLPDTGVSQEGVSRHYPVEGPAQSSQTLRQNLAAALEPHYTVHQGPVWTTDAPYRETREQIQQHQQAGVMAVDMEFTALCQVARFRNVDLAAVMLASDELFHPEWKPGFRHKKFKATRRRLLKDLVQLLSAKSPTTVNCKP